MGWVQKKGDQMTRKRLATLAALACVLGMLSVDASSKGTEDFNELSGIYRDGEKGKTAPYLELDGATGRFYLRGDLLRDIPDGARIWVRGRIKTHLYDSSRGAGPQQQPTHWQVFMVVKKYWKISEPFEKPKKTAEPAHAAD